MNGFLPPLSKEHLEKDYKIVKTQTPGTEAIRNSFILYQCALVLSSKSCCAPQQHRTLLNAPATAL